MVVDEKHTVGFDEAWYLARYPDIAVAVEEGRLPSGLEHYLSHGKLEGRFPSQTSEATSLALGSHMPLEDVLVRAIHKNFEPLLEKYLVDNSAAVVNGMVPHIRELIDETFPTLLDDAVRAELERVVVDGKATR